MNAEQLEQFEAELNQPLPGREAKPTPFEAEQEADDFMSFYAQVSGGQV